MPYVDEKVRVAIEPNTGRPAESKGELNYQITRLLIKYCEHTGVSYSSINDVLGALDGAGKEFYDRVGSTYEERKLRDNGDVGYDRLLASLEPEVTR